MIISDYHVHSRFSSDSSEDPEQIIKTAISLNYKYICFTDHHDIDFPIGKEGFDFQLDYKPYFEQLNILKDAYKSRIDVLIGVELGLMSHVKEKAHIYATSAPFDFIIGSSHLVDGIDPYYPEYYEGRTEVEAYRAYFESILENVKVIDDFDVYGHIDYVVRYGPNKNLYFNYNDYYDVFEEIFKILVSKGKGIEINTAGLYKGLGYPHPHMDILKLYRELGGEILTVGSDAHKADKIGYGFNEACEYAKEAGFKYYTIFKNRKPEFMVL